MTAFSHPALIKAVQQGDLQAAESILYRLAYEDDFNGTDSEGNTALHMAVKRSDAAMVQLLLDYHVDPNRVNHYGDMPLHLALARNYYWKIFDTALTAQARGPIIRALIEARADVNAVDGDNKKPISLLCAPRNPEWGLDDFDNDGQGIMAALIERNADVQCVDEGNNTALHFPVRGCAEALIAANADINARNIEGDSPLHRAVKHCDLNALNALIDAGADLSSTNNAGDTPLSLALKFRPMRPGFWQALINFNSLHSPLGDTFFRRHCDGSQTMRVEPIIRALIMNTSPATSTQDHQTPLWQALTAIIPGVGGAHERIAQELIANNFDINTPGPDGLSPLSLALLKGNRDLVLALINRQATPVPEDLQRARNAFGNEDAITQQLQAYFQSRNKGAK